jgi:hypothetical protein
MNINNLPQIIRLNTKLEKAKSGLNGIRDITYIAFNTDITNALLYRNSDAGDFNECIKILKKKYEAEIEAIKKEIEGIN